VTITTYLILNLANIWCDLAAGYSFHDELSCNARLCLADVFCAEKKLAIEIRYVDSVHVYHVDVSEAGKRQVLEDLTSETASANYQ